MKAHVVRLVLRCPIDRDRKYLVLARSCDTLGNVGECGGAVSPPANEQTVERERRSTSDLKQRSLAAATLTESLSDYETHIH